MDDVAALEVDAVVTTPPNDNKITDGPFNIFRSIYSTILLIFSIILITGLQFNNQTNLSENNHPIAAVLLLWGAILWLTMVEGGQASLVGLEPVDEELYKESHPKAYQCTIITNKPPFLDRYLMGRQFMVVLIVFCVNISGGPIEDAKIWGVPDWIITIMFQVGLAMIMITCNVGQLMSQVNASLCMIDYINNYFAIFTLYVALAIEVSGLLHASYVIAMLVNLAAGKPLREESAKTSGPYEEIFFWFRCLLSLAILFFALAVTMEALFSDRTTMWNGVPPWLAVIIFLILLTIVGMLEGMQIAFFAVAKIRESERGDSTIAKKTCEILYTRNSGLNMPGFMVGRQLCVVSCMFFVARVTTVTETEDGQENIFGVNDGMQGFFQLGFLGALIVTIVASISWQLVAAAFPIAFISNPLCYVLLRWCLFLEATGLCQAAWVMAAVHKKIKNFQRDEVYIGTAEERAARKREKMESGANKDDKGDKSGAYSDF